LVIPCLFVVYRWTAHPNVSPVVQSPSNKFTPLCTSRARFSTCVSSRAFSSLVQSKETDMLYICRVFDLCASNNRRKQGTAGIVEKRETATGDILYITRILYIYYTKRTGVKNRRSLRVSCVSLSSNMIRRTKFKRHFGEMHKTFLYRDRIYGSRFYSNYFFFYFFFSLRRFSEREIKIKTLCRIVIKPSCFSRIAPTWHEIFFSLKKKIVTVS
jgi:hypothetical protein